MMTVEGREESDGVAVVDVVGGREVDAFENGSVDDNNTVLLPLPPLKSVD
jgi:hypothetical protein